MSVSSDLDSLISGRPDLFGMSGGGSMVPIPSITGGSAGQSGASTGDSVAEFGNVSKGVNLFVMIGAVILTAVFVAKALK